MNLNNIDEARKAGLKSIKFTEDFNIPDSNNVVIESSKSGSEEPLKVTVEAIHTGLTRNFTFYEEAGLKAGTTTWTTPYNKPVLTHHYKMGEPIGRVTGARYNSSSLISPDKGCIEITIEVSDPEAIAKIKDKRYNTVSIGAETDSVKCSICGVNRIHSWCEHYRGEKYNEDGQIDRSGKLCYWIIGNVNFDEVSFVNIPSDPNAMVVSMSESVDGASVLNNNDKKEEANLTKPSDMEELTNKINELEQKVASLESEKEKLENDFKEAKEAWEAERSELLTKNTEVTEKYRDSVIERIVELNISLGKSDESKREELVARYEGRPLESLLYTLEDLRSEPPAKQSVVVEKVESPGLGIDESGSGKKYTIRELINEVKKGSKK